MRFLRFVALLLAVAAAYGAQVILHPPLVTTTADFFPPQLSAFFPDFSQVRALFKGDLREAAFLALAVAAVTYGLVTAPWSLTALPLAAPSAAVVTSRIRRRQRLGWLLVIGALLLAGVTALLGSVQTQSYPQPFPVALMAPQPFPVALMARWPALVSLLERTPWLTEGVWVAGLFCFFVGCALLPWRLSAAAPDPAVTPATVPKSPMASWPLLLLILGSAAVLYGWRLTEVPALIDQNVAQVGLLASDWLRNGNADFFLPAPVELEPGLYLSGLATTGTALFFNITQDLLLSVRLTGLCAALLTLVATWLLGVELFRRTPHQLASETVGDEGQWPALVATLLVMFTVATMLFSRLPVLLEMVGWGTLGSWALLRGLRTSDRLAVGLSGVLMGLSVLLYTPGLVFVLTALFWWMGYGAVQAGWLPHRPPASATTVRFRGHFFLWLVGLWVIAAPNIVLRGATYPAWLLSLRSNLAVPWQPTLLVFSQQGDLSQLAGLALPFLHDLLAPVLLLAVGALCFNLDRRLSWTLLTWLGCGLVSAMLLSTTTPNWSTLLPVLPATGLVLAFGLDRLRVTTLLTAGPWLRNLSSYLLLGLLLWVGFNNSVTYYHVGQQQVDPISALGHELRTLPAGRTITVVAPPTITDEAPQLRFLTNEWLTPPRAAVTFTTDLPEKLTAGAVVLLVPADANMLAQLQVRYPGGALVVRRDHLVNRLLYRYTLPE